MSGSFLLTCFPLLRAVDIAPQHRDDEGESPSHLGLNSTAFFALDPADFHESTGVRKLVALDVDLTSFDLSQCERKQVMGRTYVRVDYELRVYFGSKRGVLNFLCVYNGKEAGRVSVTFDGQNSNGASEIHGGGGGDGEQNAEPCSVM